MLLLPPVLKDIEKSQLCMVDSLLPVKDIECGRLSLKRSAQQVTNKASRNKMAANLKAFKCILGESKLGLEVLRDLSAKASERKPSQAKLRAFLISSYLSQGNSACSIPTNFGSSTFLL